MGIVSTLANIADEAGRRYLVLDTSFNGKRLTTAVAVSQDLGEHLSQAGQQVVRLALIHHQAQHHAGAVHRVQVLAAEAARERVRQVLEAVAAGDLVCFFGADDAVCAALMRALGLRSARPG